MIREAAPVDVNIDELAMKVFIKALEIAGGPRRLIELRNLTWVPSLIEASYAVVMSEEQNKTADEIARFLGVGTQTVRNILRADTEAVEKRISEAASGDESVRTHIAGGLAKKAYKNLKSELGAQGSPS